MRELLAIATVALSLPSFAPAIAQDAWLRGEWCSGDGERMIVERSGPGFNEHTMCEWLAPPQKGDRINVRISCANFYGEQKAFERIERFRAVKTGPNSVSVRLGAQRALAYAKC